MWVIADNTSGVSNLGCACRTQVLPGSYLAMKAWNEPRISSKVRENAGNLKTSSLYSQFSINQRVFIELEPCSWAIVQARHGCWSSEICRRGSVGCFSLRKPIASWLNLNIHRKKFLGIYVGNKWMYMSKNVHLTHTHDMKHPHIPAEYESLYIGWGPN